jgi:hypothetical protein
MIKKDPMPLHLIQAFERIHLILILIREANILFLLGNKALFF